MYFSINSKKISRRGVLGTMKFMQRAREREREEAMALLEEMEGGLSSSSADAATDDADGANGDGGSKRTTRATKSCGPFRAPARPARKRTPTARRGG
jgi:U3 small nucleolar RNA-associated protein 14